MPKALLKGAIETPGESSCECIPKSYLHVKGQDLINSFTAVRLVCISEILSQRTIICI